MKAALPMSLARFLGEFFAFQPREVPMEMVYVNGWAVLAAAGANMLVGLLWYSPLLFGRAWMRLRGLTRETRPGRGRAMAIAAAGALLTSAVMAYLFGILGPDHMIEGLIASALLWLGLVLPFDAIPVGFERKPVSLFVIDTGNRLVTLLAMGAILTVFR